MQTNFTELTNLTSGFPVSSPIYELNGGQTAGLIVGVATGVAIILIIVHIFARQDKSAASDHGGEADGNDPEPYELQDRTNTGPPTDGAVSTENHTNAGLQNQETQMGTVAWSKRTLRTLFGHA